MYKENTIKLRTIPSKISYCFDFLGLRILTLKLAEIKKLLKVFTENNVQLNKNILNMKTIERSEMLQMLQIRLFGKKKFFFFKNGIFPVFEKNMDSSYK